MALSVRTIFAKPVYQIGYVFPTMDEHISRFQKELGCGEFMRTDNSGHHNETFRGAPHKSQANMAFGFMGETNIEIIQPLSGENVYSLFLDQKPEGGLHHLCWVVEDLDPAAAAMEQAGFEMIQSASVGPGGTRIAYFDTRRTLGHFVEFAFVDPQMWAAFEALRGTARA